MLTCDDLTAGVEFAMDGSQQMFACQKSLYFFLERELTEREKKVDAIVVDSSVSFPMGQVAHKLLTNQRNANRWLNKDALMIIVSLSGKGGEWRRSFADSFREDVGAE